MPGGYIGEADILIGADASDLAKDVQRQAQANLKAVGAQLGRSLSESVGKAAGAAAEKAVAPLATGVKKAASTARQSLNNLTSGFKSAEAAASAFSGKLGTLGGAARKALDPAITSVNNFRAGLNNSQAAASAFTGRMGTLGGIASRAITPAVTAINNFRAGFGSAQAGLSSFTGKMGTLGTVARSAMTLVGSAFQALGPVANAAWSAVKAGADKLWSALKSGASSAASTIGATLKAGLSGAAGAAGLAAGAAVGTGIVKGFGRLNALDTAQKRFEGLNMSAADITATMASVDRAVTGTSFSMSEAASAAAMFATSGVKAGADMDAALQGLTAAAAASGKSMGDITPIINKIAGSGRVMGGELDQLTENGVPALAALSNYLGLTADETRKLASEGGISFADFNAAMSSQLGGLASSMAQTWDGMRGNVLSNMGRIGAAVQKPIFNGLMAAMPGVVDMMRNLAKAASDLMEPFADRLVPAATKLGEAMASINFSPEGLTSFAETLGPLLPLLGALVGGPLAGMLSGLPLIGPMFQGLSGPIGLVAGALVALLAIDPSTLARGFETLVTKLQSSLPGMMDKVIGFIEKGLNNLVQNLPTMLNGILQVVLLLVQQLAASLPRIIPMLVQAIGTLIPAVIQALLSAIPLLLNAALQLFGALVTGLLDSLPMLVETLVSAIPMLVETLANAVPMILDGALQMFLGILDGLLAALPQVITALVDAIPDVIVALLNAIPKIIDGAIQFFLGLVTGLAEAIPQIIMAVINAIPQLIQALLSALPQIITAGIDMFLGLITGLIEALPQIISAVIEMIPVLVSGLIDAIPQIIEAGFQLFLGLIEGLWNALPQIWEAITSDLLPSIWNAITGGGDDAEESGKNLGERAAGGLSSTSSSFSSVGSTLGASATSGLSSTTESMSLAANSLGTTATSTLSSYSGQMTTAASTLGQGAVTGLSGETENAKLAAADLANAATIDATAKVEQATAAGKRIASGFANGISEGAADAGKAAAAVADAAQASLSKVTGFVAVGRSLAGGIATGVQQGTPNVIFSLQALAVRSQQILIAGIVTTIGNAFSQLWVARLAPTLALMVSGFTAALQRIRDLWGGMAASLSQGLYQSIIPTLNALSKAVLLGPPVAFAQAVSAITAAWDRIREAAARPARFVVHTVMNGMIGAMNQIPGVSVPRLSAGFARGGVLPGYDSIKRDTILTPMRKGEGVLVPEVVKGLGASTIHALNRAGNTGGASAVRARFGSGLARGGLVTPLPRGSFTVSQPWHRGHNGIDLAAAMGTKVYAAAKGKVMLAGVVPMGGNEIYIQHDNGLGTRYSHLSSFAARVGQTVRKNQVIGRVGSTGMSTGPHLHYMVHNPGGGPGNYGNNVNPAAYMGLYGTEVEGYIDEMREMAASYRRAFAMNFPSSNRFNAASGGIMNQGLSAIIASAQSRIGSDDIGSTGIRPYLYDNGGWVDPGLNLLLNKSGKPEAVLTNEESMALKAMLRDGGGRQVVIEQGAIVIQGAVDPEKTSIRVLDRIAEELE